MVFDVESVGLHGEGFAVGYVVVDAAGKELESGLFACPVDRVVGEFEGREWVVQHVPRLALTHNRPQAVRTAFWQRWLHWKAQGAVLVADCGWPVEARFLAACVDDAPERRGGDGPYPLHDLASVLWAHGRDPLATHERRPDEQPAHHPLMDARQSARLLVHALNARGPAEAAAP
jgi:hypothetical protein